MAVIADAPVDDGGVGVSNSTEVGDEFGVFAFMKAVFDDDLSVCEDAFDEKLNDSTSMAKVDVDFDSTSVGSSPSSSSSYGPARGRRVRRVFWLR